MRCLVADRWSDRYLDPHRAAADYRIRVLAFAPLRRLRDVYFVPERSPRLLWNYLREVGPTGVWRKVSSRLQERHRNEKFVSFGLGEILEGPPGGRFATGAPVAFLAPGYPACVERVVLPEPLIAERSAGIEPALTPDAVLLVDRTASFREPGPWWSAVEAWSPYSGEGLEPAVRRSLEAFLGEMEKDFDGSGGRSLPIPRPSPVRERVGRAPSPRRASRKQAVLFGYGHYAKTNILPNVRRYLDVAAIHELDPTQIPDEPPGARLWDTAPFAREDERFDVFLVAGFHHTHAPVAAEALRRGAVAVVEKPLAVDTAQLGELLVALESPGADFFACFHRRYSPLNDYVALDLRQSPEEPIDYHCIVYEVPLPARHWYRWANSRSRIVSNGCHWIDHFLYLNGYEEVETFHVAASREGTLHCAASLVNGATFTMTLTEKGSPRIGLQDHVELRAKDKTITIVNNSRYVAEDRTRIVRRARHNKMGTYRIMYRDIARRIARGEGGDPLRSVRVSTELVLALDAALGAG